MTLEAPTPKIIGLYNADFVVQCYNDAQSKGASIERQPDYKSFAES